MNPVDQHVSSDRSDRSDRPVLDLTSTKRAAKDWLPADVVPTSGLVEGTAVLATQSLSDELLKALPKAVPWRNNKEGECSQKSPKNGRVKFTKAKCVFQCISCFCHRGLGDVWTVYRDCQPCGSMRCLFLRHIKWECGQQTWRLYQQ